MERPDVVVVGGGPAGATAARLLAERGARVVLLEARPIPRPKLCGGGLTPKVLPFLAGAAAQTIVRRVERVELSGGRVPPLHLHLPAAPIAFVERASFDAALVAAAARAGVEVRDGWPVHDLVADESHLLLRGPRGDVRGAVVVAADGDPSRIATRLSMGPPRRRSLALEVDLPFSASRRPDELQLRFGIRGGYAWYFPKADHANVGVLSWRGGSQRGLRETLRRYARSLGLERDLGDARVKGHWIPQGLRAGGAVRGRVLLAGDAAATGDPFFGEGIAYAMSSALLAADAISAWADGQAPLHAYDAALHHALAPAMRQLTLVSEIADFMPSVSLAALRISGWARGQGIQAVGGTGRPFVLPTPRPGVSSR